MREYLDVKEDRFLEPEKLAVIAASGAAMDDLLDELAELKGSAIDVEEAVRRAMDEEKVPDAVRREILKAMEAKK